MVKRLVGYVVAAALALAVVMYVLHQVEQFFLPNRDAEITRASHAQLKVHAGLVRYRAQLRQAERAGLAQVARDSAAADSLRRLLASGLRTDTVRILFEIARRDSSAARGCSLVVMQCQARAESAEREAAALHRQLGEQVTVRDHRCGIFAGVGPVDLQFDRWRGTAALGCRVLRLPFLP